MAETLETVISRIKPVEHARFADACAEAARHVRAMTFDGTAFERKWAMLREAVRYRNERLSA